MKQYKNDKPVLEIQHHKKDNFKVVIGVINPDGSDHDIDQWDPVLVVTKGPTVVLTFENADITKTEFSEVVIKKDSLAFENMTCLDNYRHRFYNRATNETFLEGVFKII